ncbi:MAG: secretin N-terminal domain-containing protein [Aliarcobacter sp.]|nr:secretin N-terminal domain-containing protein [Aliarcobacter sp.]
MKLNKLFFLVILTFNLFSNDEININFKDLKIMDFIKITSKILNRNILITQEIEGNVNFVSNKPLNKNELIKILNYVLEDKGYNLVFNDDIYRVIKLNNELPLLDNKIDSTKDEFIKKEIKIFPLKNIEASNIIKIVDSIISKNIYVNPNNKPLISIDEDSNSIIVKAPIEEIDEIKLLLEELDVEKAQVYVQARIIELNDELVNQIGVTYGIFAGSTNNNGLTTFSSSLNKGNIPKFSVDGLTIPDITSGLALGATLNLLRQNGALDIVSEPSILAVNNKESSIYVGETISIKTSSSVTDGGTTRENFQREDVGLTLKVKPRISNETKVTLEINTILEGVKTTQTVSGNADTSKKEVKTTAILNNGESVIIGGLIENKTEITNQKVPVLGDIPLFGELFKNSISNNKKNNLVVIITPYLIPKTKDITFIRNKLSELKMLEDKYLEDSLIKLKENSLKKRVQDKNRKEKLKELDKEIKEVELNSNINNHEKRVKEILGY